MDMISLFPAKTFKDRPNGMRPDIAQMIADLKPGFVRFPGGCVVESTNVETAYNWKDTVGPVEQRPEMWNVWDYRRTHGVGLYEYFQFIKDIGAEPMWVGFAGQTCVNRNPEVVPMDQMQPIIDNYIDLMEYANGPATSKWGKLRADAGHPDSFKLKLVEIGNENSGEAYIERYNLIQPILKQKFPEMLTISNIPIRNGAPVEMVDNRHYSSPTWFINNARTYDGRNRNGPKLYLGEVAVTSGQGVRPERGNLWAALAEGIYLIGCERNSDLVHMVSYAPLLGHVDGRTELAGAPPPWHAMIYHDSTRVFGTVSYYLWKEFGLNVPTYNVEKKVVDANPQTQIVGNVGVGTWGWVRGGRRRNSAT
jgi:alpha-L-arabinofuranosidase